MLRRIISGVIVLGLMSTVAALSTYAASRAVKQDQHAARQDEKQRQAVEKLKKKIAAIGVGEKARVTIKLKNQTTEQGYISALNDDSFVITDKKTGATTTIAYSDIERVDRPFTGKQRLLGLVAFTGAAFVVLLILLAKNLK